jgi:phage antirepressor YoqD-like protein
MKEIWRTECIIVDRNTGEIIKKRRLENGEYIKVKTTTKYEKDGNINKKRITHECREGQQRIFGTD